MSYCVHCGVELDNAAKACPLCHTPVVDPTRLELPEDSPYFPTRPPVVEPVSRYEMAFLLTAMLISAAVACSVLNIFLQANTGWSLYVSAAAVTLWIWFVLPLIFRKIPMFLRLTLDVLAIGLYVYFVSVHLNGSQWFNGLALPIILLAGIESFVLGYLLRENRVSALSSVTICIGAVGFFCLGIEYCIDRYLANLWEPGWSIIVVTVCAALIVPLIVIRRVPSLREEARRRFHL